MVNYEFIDNTDSVSIIFKDQDLTVPKNEAEFLITNLTDDKILEIRSNSVPTSSLKIDLNTDTITGIGIGSTTATELKTALIAIFFLDESGGGGGGELKYSATWNVANTVSASALSGTAYATLIIPESDITVTEMETFITSASVGAVAYVGIYNQAGTTLLGESVVLASAVGLSSNTLVGGGSVTLTGGQPYWFTILEGAGAANFADKPSAGNVALTKSGYIDFAPTGLPATITSFTSSVTSVYVAAKA